MTLPDTDPNTGADYGPIATFALVQKSDGNLSLVRNSWGRSPSERLAHAHLASKELWFLSVIGPLSQRKWPLANPARFSFSILSALFGALEHRFNQVRSLPRHSVCEVLFKIGDGRGPTRFHA